MTLDLWCIPQSTPESEGYSLPPGRPNPLPSSRHAFMTKQAEAIVVLIALHHESAHLSPSTPGYTHEPSITVAVLQAPS
jgi:hypothetical protein